MSEIYRIKLLPAAEDDLDDIDKYFIDSPATGDKIFESIAKAIKQLEIFPYLGHIPDDQVIAEKGFRRLVVNKRYNVFYKVLVNVVQVHRIIHSDKLGRVLLNKD